MFCKRDVEDLSKVNPSVLNQITLLKVNSGLNLILAD